MTYTFAGAHRTMVFDELRNAAYAQAIRKFVSPDTTVLDLGAGLGIHGLAAAAAGARRVYLVDPEPIVQIALEAARANGLAERIVVLEGNIEDVVLPESVDLIISVFVGNLLFTEDLLPSLFHARDRYLKPHGQLIPDFAELVLTPLAAADIHAKHVSQWSRPALGLDFSTARRFAANEILWPSREELRAHTERLAVGAVVATVDLKAATQADCRGEALCHIERSGTCHGLLGSVRMRLGEAWLSTDPMDPEVHWPPGLLPLDPPLPVEAGEDIRVRLQRPARGDWTWIVTAASGHRRHSSFLARADGARRLGRMAPAHRAFLNRRGDEALQILELMRQGRSNEEIAEILAGEAPAPAPAIDDALLRVQALALRYGKQD